MIAAIILFSIAIGIAVWSITVSSLTKQGDWLAFLIFTPVGIAGSIVALDSIPTNKDVRNGKAYYVEQNHIEIVNGDTVTNYKTYQIEWNQNTK